MAASIEKAGSVPVFLREEGGGLCAYLGEPAPGAGNDPFLIINTEHLNATPGALDLVRALVSAVGQSFGKLLREELTVQLLRDSMPKGPTQ